MTPYEINVILHIHTCIAPFESSGIKPSELLKATLEQLIELDIIKVDDDRSVHHGHIYETTPRGMTFVQMLCDTPFPEQKWIDPRTETKT
jgi:DNA-binding HxlR family transcriptional regulator